MQTVNLGKVAGIIYSPNEPKDKTVIWGRQNDLENDPNDVSHLVYRNQNWVELSTRGIGEIIQFGMSLPDALDQLGDDGTNWVESNGQSCAGSTYETITGNSTVPNLTGVGGLVLLIKIN